MNGSIRVKLKQPANRFNNNNDIFRIRKYPGSIRRNVGLFPSAWFPSLGMAIPDLSGMAVQGLVPAEAQAREHERLSRRSAERGHGESLIE